MLGKLMSSKLSCPREMVICEFLVQAECFFIPLVFQLEVVSVSLRSNLAYGFSAGLQET